MNLTELHQVKQDLADGIIVSREKWKQVLETAIEQQTPVKKEIHDEYFHNLAMDYRSAQPMQAHVSYQALTDYIERWHMGGTR